ncbi:MAG: ABC transporter permease [Spirochaetales bacterium]
MKQSRFVLFSLIFLYFFLIGPFLLIFLASFGSEAIMTFPPKGFSLRWFEKVFTVRMFLDAFIISLGLGILSTLAALILGVPIAYALVRYQFVGKGVMEVVFASPAVIPGIVLGFALLRYFILVGNVPIKTSLFLGHTVILLPYTVRVVSAALRNLDLSIEEAAISLGAHPLRSFFLVILPNVQAGVIAAFILAFITSFNNVPLSLLLTGPGIATLPIQMLIYMEYYFDPTIAALSSILIVLTVGIVQTAEKVLGISKYV